MPEYVICGASLETICSGKLPPEDLIQTVNHTFADHFQATAGYRILPRILGSGEDAIDQQEDGTYRTMPDPIEHDDVLIRGALICTACYVTLCLLSPSGGAEYHEIRRAIEKARTIDPKELPRIR